LHDTALPRGTRSPTIKDELPTIWVKGRQYKNQTLLIYQYFQKARERSGESVRDSRDEKFNQLSVAERYLNIYKSYWGLQMYIDEPVCF
jgi:hypothetical protein